MKSPLNHSRCHAAFTIIELLIVMAVILVLAGLIINTAGSANYNSAKSRAAAEIKAMETALESYKTDNGTYPPDPFTPTDPSATVPTNMLDAHTVTDSANVDPTSSRYILNSEYLYQILSGFPVRITGMKLPAATSAAMSTAYMKFTPQQLHAAPDAGKAVASPNNSMMYIIDPFGFSYGYSTVYAANLAHNNAASTSTTAGTVPPVITQGYNPTFDLWSTAGYAPGGKTKPAASRMGSSDEAVNYSTLWVKNW